MMFLIALCWYWYCLFFVHINYPVSQKRDTIGTLLKSHEILKVALTTITIYVPGADGRHHHPSPHRHADERDAVSVSRGHGSWSLVVGAEPDWTLTGRLSMHWEKESATWDHMPLPLSSCLLTRPSCTLHICSENYTSIVHTLK